MDVLVAWAPGNGYLVVGVGVEEACEVMVCLYRMDLARAWFRVKDRVHSGGVICKEKDVVSSVLAFCELTSGDGCHHETCHLGVVDFRISSKAHLLCLDFYVLVVQHHCRSGPWEALG